MVYEKPITSKILHKNNKPSYVKIYHEAEKYFGSKDAYIFCHLEFLYNSVKRPFYKFIAPCKHILCKNGETLSEELHLSERIVIRRLNRIRTSYKSKSLYLKALEELGKDGVFKGMPFLSYQDGSTYLTTYDMNPRIVREILDGKWVKSIKEHIDITLLKKASSV